MYSYPKHRVGGQKPTPNIGNVYMVLKLCQVIGLCTHIVLPIQSIRDLKRLINQLIIYPNLTLSYTPPYGRTSRALHGGLIEGSQ
jgi:hypothetical protein